MTWKNAFTETNIITHPSGVSIFRSVLRPATRTREPLFTYNVYRLPPETLICESDKSVDAVLTEHGITEDWEPKASSDE